MTTKTPTFGEPLAPHHANGETLELLLRRRSTAADLLGPPGPGAEDVEQLLALAARVPDHRCVVPFRFIVFGGDARAAAGEVLKSAFAHNEPEASVQRIEAEQKRFMRAPLVIAVVSKVDQNHRTPEWEQILSAGAACQNLLIGANAKGYAAQWLTEWYAYDRQVLSGFGLSGDERVAGFIYIGTAAEPPKERRRPIVDDITTKFT